MENLKIYSDSQLVVNQVAREYQAEQENMALYLNKVKSMLQMFKWYTIILVP